MIGPLTSYGISVIFNFYYFFHIRLNLSESCIYRLISQLTTIDPEQHCGEYSDVISVVCLKIIGYILNLEIK